MIINLLYNTIILLITIPEGYSDVYPSYLLYYVLSDDFRSSQAAESFFEGLVNLFMHICAFLPLLFGIMILILSFQKLFS